MKRYLIFLLPLWLLACEPDSPLVAPTRQPVELVVPAHFPQPPVPATNVLTEAKIKLGKRLFFDPLLSQDMTISCGSCHPPENAFADPRPFSLGVGGVSGDEPSKRRNAPALFNVVYHQNFFWDGSNPSLETQILFPIESPFEMATKVDTVLRRLRAHPEYPRLFWQTFQDTISAKTLTDAIASYERSLISAGSKFDQFMAAGMDSSVFTPAEWRGYKLFFLESAANNHAECFHCHGGFNFDDPEGRFRNNGLYSFYQDFGRFNVTGNPLDVGRFKVPSLRNIEYTAPYMHDGSLETLEDVLAHYASGGQPHPNRDILIGNISMTLEEQQDIIAFLKTLSDPDFVNNPAHRPE